MLVGLQQADMKSCIYIRQVLVLLVHLDSKNADLESNMIYRNFHCKCNCDSIC